MHPSVKAAIAYFPDRGHAIAELARTDEDFLSLCEDLAASEEALAIWERSHSSARAARCSEYRELIRDLTAELAAELDRQSQR